MNRLDVNQPRYSCAAMWSHQKFAVILHDEFDVTELPSAPRGVLPNRGHFWDRRQRYPQSESWRVLVEESDQWQREDGRKVERRRKKNQRDVSGRKNQVAGGECQRLSGRLQGAEENLEEKVNPIVTKFGGQSDSENTQAPPSDDEKDEL